MIDSLPKRLSRQGVKERREAARGIVEPILTGKRDRTVARIYKRLTPGSDGCIHTVLSPSTASGRLASSEDGVNEASTALQNLAKKIARLDALYRVRDVLVPEPGMIFLAGDYTNAEALLVAAYSEDWEYFDKIMNGEDTHAEHARHFFGLEPGIDLKKDPDLAVLRDIAKSLSFASFYRASVYSVMMTLNQMSEQTGRRFSQEETADLHSILLELHPLPAWWDSVSRLLKKNGGWLRNALGYKRTFYDPEPDNRLKDGLSFFPQSTVATLVNRALPNTHEKIDVPGKREVLHQMHDELLFQCKPNQVEIIQECATREMEKLFVVNGREIYVPVGWSIGDDWGHMEPIPCPEVKREHTYPQWDAEKGWSEGP